MIEHIKTEPVKRTRIETKWRFLSTLKVGHSVFTTADRIRINSACTRRRPKKFSVNKTVLDGQEGFTITRNK